VQEGFATMSQQAQEVFSGIRVIKSFVKENYFLGRFRIANDVYGGRNMRLVRVWGVFNPAVTFLAGLTTLILLWFGGKAVIAGQLTIGSFVAVYSYLGMLIWPVLGAGMTVNMIQRGRASLVRVNAILAEEPDIASPPVAQSQAPNGTIEVRNLSFRYPDSAEPALKSLSFRIEQGQTIGILGRTGSGKTTLIKILPRLLDPPEGTVFIDGFDVRKYHLQSLRSSFGVVPQDTFLFSATIRDNIRFGLAEADDAMVLRAADISTISRDIGLFSDGWETEIGERGVTLSGGQKQRMAISRALAIRPNVLIFDDALSAVDTHTEEQILRELLKFRQGKTSIIVSHRVSTLSVADRIIVLDGGRIVQEGSHQELLAEEGYYRQVHRLQQLAEHHTEVE